VSSISSDEIVANHAVYIGRASFRFDYGPASDATQGLQELRDLRMDRGVARTRRLEVALPVWMLVWSGILAFGVGLAVAAAAVPRAHRTDAASVDHPH
jgi:hypothetical protein